MHLIIVRHGETQWTISGQHTGTTDLALTERGESQSVAIGPLLGHLLKGERPSVYVSPRIRTVRTAQLAIAETEMHLEPLVVEFDYGIYEGKTFDEIRSIDPTWNIWRDGCPGGESINDVAIRADAFLESHVDGVDHPVVVFTHGHFSRILVVRALGLDPTDGARLVSSPGSISTVVESHGQPSIGLWNASADLLDAARSSG